MINSLFILTAGVCYILCYIFVVGCTIHLVGSLISLWDFSSIALIVVLVWSIMCLVEWIVSEFNFVWKTVKVIYNTIIGG